jgi:hypothetical protein
VNALALVCLLLAPAAVGRVHPQFPPAAALKAESNRVWEVATGLSCHMAEHGGSDELWAVWRGLHDRSWCLWHLAALQDGAADEDGVLLGHVLGYLGEPAFHAGRLPPPFPPVQTSVLPGP